MSIGSYDPGKPDWESFFHNTPRMRELGPDELVSRLYEQPDYVRERFWKTADSWYGVTELHWPEPMRTAWIGFLSKRGEQRANGQDSDSGLIPPEALARNLESIAKGAGTVGANYRGPHLVYSNPESKSDQIGKNRGKFAKIWDWLKSKGLRTPRGT